uniref:Uncharacterized protein n=1 Tax=Utricularia reniformis TaxID=192314 RepID=A0A1Y0AYQ8_9LAMI|nr:hypothetical protein AEK19_MT0474 [Utricularia reniformis]ART30292.1 hypothetical protein AEK19_MT0474 [Utricularia reniformis]
MPGRHFSNLISQANLMDIPLVGGRFTWISPCATKIIRIDWFRQIDYRSGLDFHCVVSPSPITGLFLSRSIQLISGLPIFQRMDEDLDQLVRNSWALPTRAASGASLLITKLKRLK